MSLDELIIEADEFFMRNGYKASLDQFCKENKISKKTVYKHFKSKEDLIRLIFNRRIQTIEDLMVLPSEEGTNSVSMMISNNIRMRGYIDPTQQRKNFSELHKYYPKLFDELIERTGNVITKVLIPVIRKGVKDGVFLEHLNPETVATIYKNFFMLLRIMKEEDHETARTIVDSSFLMFLRSLLTAKGFEFYDKEKQRIEENFMIG